MGKFRIYFLPDEEKEDKTWRFKIMNLLQRNSVKIIECNSLTVVRKQKHRSHRIASFRAPLPSLDSYTSIIIIIH